MPVKNKICLVCAHGLFKCACVATNILVFVFFSVPTVAFDPILQTVKVHPTSKSGSTVATLKLWIDEAVLDSSTGLSILKYFSLVHHNFSDQIVPRFSHVRPLFEMSPSENSSISSIFYLNLDSATLPHLIASSMERCAVTSSAKRYVAISIDLKLLSDSLYHLGDHNIYIYGYLYSPNNSYTFDTILKLRVEAGLINLPMSLTLSLIYKCQFAHLVLYEVHTLYWIMNTLIITLSLSVHLFQSVRTVLNCMTLNSIAVCLLAHVGIVHSDHTHLHTVKQVCLTSMTIPL